MEIQSSFRDLARENPLGVGFAVGGAIQTVAGVATAVIAGLSVLSASSTAFGMGTVAILATTSFSVAITPLMLVGLAVAVIGILCLTAGIASLRTTHTGRQPHNRVTPSPSSPDDTVVRLQTEVAGLRTQLTEAQEEVERFRNAQNTGGTPVVGSSSSPDDAVVQLQAEVTELRTQLTEAQEEVERLRNAQNASTSPVEGPSSSPDDAVVQLQAEVADLQTQLTEAQEEVERLRNAQNASASPVEGSSSSPDDAVLRLQAEVTELRAQLREAEEEVERLRIQAQNTGGAYLPPPPPPGGGVPPPPPPPPVGRVPSPPPPSSGEGPFKPPPGSVSFADLITAGQGKLKKPSVGNGQPGSKGGGSGAIDMSVIQQMAQARRARVEAQKGTTDQTPVQNTEEELTELEKQLQRRREKSKM